jgi:hypothetical protein
MNLWIVIRVEGGSYGFVCCKNTLTVFDDSEIRSFGKRSVCWYEGTRFLSLGMFY